MFETLELALLHEYVQFQPDDEVTGLKLWPMSSRPRAPDAQILISFCDRSAVIHGVFIISILKKNSKIYTCFDKLQIFPPAARCPGDRGQTAK